MVKAFLLTTVIIKKTLLDTSEASSSQKQKKKKKKHQDFDPTSSLAESDLKVDEFAQFTASRVAYLKFSYNSFVLLIGSL